MNVTTKLVFKKCYFSFPGGSIEAIDEFDCVRAALRETNEEIGLNLADVSVLGELPSTLGRVSYVLKWVSRMILTFNYNISSSD